MSTILCGGRGCCVRAPVFLGLYISDPSCPNIFPPHFILGSLNYEMGIFKNSRVYVLATVAYTGSFLFGTTNLFSIGYQIQHANIFPEKDMIRV